MDHWGSGKVKVIWHEPDSNRRPLGLQSTTLTIRPREQCVGVGVGVGGVLISVVPRINQGGHEASGVL